MRVAVSLMAQTGRSGAIHSPDACARTVVRLIIRGAWSMEVVCTVAISRWPSTLRTRNPSNRGGGGQCSYGSLAILAAIGQCTCTEVQVLTSYGQWSMAAQPF